MTEYASEMRLFDPETGDRLYMDETERERFLKAATALDNLSHRMLCRVIHWTGCRISEALELTHRRIDPDACMIRFRTLKKRKRTRKGEIKAPVFRDVPIPKDVSEGLDLVFKIRTIRKSGKDIDLPLWGNRDDKTRSMSRVTGWRIIKRVLDAAEIQGKQATPKGFRHGAAVALVMGGMDIHVLQRILGHEQVSTTAVYLQFVGQEAHDLQMQYWKKANAHWEI